LIIINLESMFWRRSKVWKELERAVLFEAEDREVAAVEGKDGADAFTLCRLSECGVGELQAGGFETLQSGGARGAGRRRSVKAG